MVCVLRSKSRNGWSPLAGLRYGMAANYTYCHLHKSGGRRGRDVGELQRAHMQTVMPDRWGSETQIR